MGMFHNMMGTIAFGKSRAPVAKPDAPTTHSTAVHVTQLLDAAGPSAQWAGQMRALARETFAKMRPKVGRANKFLASANKRVKAGKLNKVAYMAEAAPLNMAVYLHGTLTKMYDKSKRLDDARPLARVTMAAAILSGHLDSKTLMHEGVYPEGDEAIFNGLVTERLSHALSLHRKVCAELHDAPEVLGIPLPKPSTEAPTVIKMAAK